MYARTSELNRIADKLAPITGYPHAVVFRTASTLKNAFNRCLPGYKDHRNYFDRGIQFTFSNLTEATRYVLETLGPCPPEHSIDRIDNDAGYSPGNLRWATKQQQWANRRCRASPQR